MYARAQTLRESFPYFDVLKSAILRRKAYAPTKGPCQGSLVRLGDGFLVRLR